MNQVLRIDKKIDDYFLNILKRNKKISTEFSKECLLDLGVSHESKKGLFIFNIKNKKYLVRNTSGSSSEKGLGRSLINDVLFETKFDAYLVPVFTSDSIVFNEVSKEAM